MGKNGFIGVKKDRLTAPFKLSCAAISALLTVASAHGWANSSEQSMRELTALEQNWPEAHLQLGLESGRDGDDSVVVGDDIRYRLSAAEAGNCYLLHFDSHGQATLMKPASCAASAGGKVASAFPETGNLSAGKPLGEERVFAILSQDKLPAAEQLLQGTAGFAALNSEQALAELVGGITASAGSQKLAVAALAYQVDSAEVQFTTRGIIRKVVAAKDDANESAVLAKFDVQSIQFDFGSDILTDAGRLQLDAFGAALKSPELADTNLKVAGHTDDQGEELYNQDLSMRRAKAVREYIEDRYQIDRQRISTKGYGESSPLVGNENRESRAQNRRVEMVFTTE